MVYVVLVFLGLALGLHKGAPATLAPGALPSAPPAATAPIVAPSEAALPYVIVPPATTPAVTEIAVSGATLHSGGPFAVRVTAAPDVTEVAIEGYGRRFDLTPAGGGRFAAAGTLPSVPWLFLHRSYDLAVVAQDGAGNRTSIPVRIRLDP